VVTGLTLGGTAVSVAFRSTGDGGDAITGYTVTCTSSNGGTTRGNTDVGSPIVVSLLSIAKSYTCGVTATNAIGTGARSAASSAFVAATAPSAPTVTAITRGNNSASVAFTTPASNGSGITKYTATCTSSDGGTTRTGTNNRSPLNVLGLTIGKTYTCQLTATNALGTSGPSISSATFVA
jgi:Fibronectin type III domain